jgi:hypothetical protein
MRGSMDPLTPTTHTLGPAISHIAQTAASLSSSMHNIQPQSGGLGIQIHVESDEQDKRVLEEELQKKKKQKDTVKWVLDTPRRLRNMLDEGQDVQAQNEWDEVSNILNRWGNVAGVQELRDECQQIMNEEVGSD